jgi:spermidine/putrescine transport system permease protein
MPAILASIAILALPMFGDYYTPDLLSQSPNTSLIGNQIVLYIRGQQVPVGAALVVVLMAFLAVLMGYYLVATARTQRRLGR